MKLLYIKYLLIVLLQILVFSCKPYNLDEKQLSGYTICLGEFQSFDEADVYKSKMDFDLWRDMKIVNVETKKFLLLYHSFNSSFEAGKKAFELYSKSTIYNYKIFKEKEYVRDDFANTFFVAKYQGRASVYNYNLISKKTSLVWSRWGRKVITLNHAPNYNSAFFTTALGYGRKGSFPYVRDARVYFYDFKKELFSELDELDSGIQIYTYWEGSDTFKVNITKPDSIKSDILRQEIYSYNTDGERIGKKERSFNIIVDGFPKPPTIIPRNISSTKKYLLREVKDEKKYFINLKNLKSNSEIMLLENDSNLINSYWSSDDKYLFLFTNKNKKVNADIDKELYIINTESTEIIKKFTSIKYPQLIINGNFIFFTEYSGRDSKIIIYDFYLNNIFDQILMSGGCGISQLP
ncbi:MAG: hypothetical protein FJ214_01590 [Ignavibacteria bacterium]|nr:hypothetical protein [Ignavibacteria bacterium]